MGNLFRDIIYMWDQRMSELIFIAEEAEEGMKLVPMLKVPG